jgi:hypothetical protein
VAEVPGSPRAWRDGPRRWLGEQADTRRPSEEVGREALARLGRPAAGLPAGAWRPPRLRAGAAGPPVFEFARRRVGAVRRRRAGPPLRVVSQRALGPGPELRYYFSKAPAGAPPEALAQVAGRRRRVEEFVEGGKGHPGLADYEARGRASWHRPRSPAALAHLYVTPTRRRRQPAPPGLTLGRAMRLLKAGLPRPRSGAEGALHLVDYHLRRNATAQASHRKTWIANHPGIAEKLLL